MVGKKQETFPNSNGGLRLNGDESHEGTDESHEGTDESHEGTDESHEGFRPPKHVGHNGPS